MEVNFEFSEKQRQAYEALMDQDKEIVLFAGGIRSGKSVLMVMWSPARTHKSVLSARSVRDVFCIAITMPSNMGNHEEHKGHKALNLLCG